MAATTTSCDLRRPGEHVLPGQRRLRRHLPPLRQGVRAEGLRFDLRRPTVQHRARRADLGDDTRLVWLETPTNPLLNVVDLRAAADAAHAPARSSSWTTPSPRRTSSGRSSSAPTSSSTRRRSTSAATPTSSAAFAATADDELRERLAFLQNSLGGVPGPFDCWLVLRGLKTLGVRMERHCENAAPVAEFLAAHPTVEQVLYPGPRRHPGHDIAAAPDGRLRRHGLVPGAAEERAVALGRPHAGSYAAPRASAASRA